MLIVITLISGSSLIYLNAKSWLWIDKNAKQFGGLILPWSYVINSARYYDSNLRPRADLILLPEAINVNPRKVVVVLVIGESARSQNFSLYGYGRKTNPLLSSAGVVAMPNTVSCSTYTTQSLRCILSHLGGETPLRETHEPLPTYLKRQGVEVVWRTNNFGEPAISVNRRQSAEEIRRECKGVNCESLNYDEVLLHKLDEQLLSSTNEKVFVVLHQSGSHGPLYFKKYPPTFEAFQPSCKSVDQQKCTQQELLNAYDNSILYTDYVLNEVVRKLKSMREVDSVMLYVSDHGESLGEYGLYLHGTPFSIAPVFQKQVPFIAWMSDSFVLNRGLTGMRINTLMNYSHDNIFHSVMGGLGLRSGAYDERLDIFSVAEKRPSK
jgi:lipid A ethanolaminephosphotransferase